MKQKMKIFLSALENGHRKGTTWLNSLEKMPFKMKWNLMSYYYARGKSIKPFAELIRDNSELIMIDSGAHSFQKGVRVNWEEYTKKYMQFMKDFDRPNVLGYFELDIDVIVGYQKVLELRKRLMSASNKIIPVWHKNRGIAEFDKMCKEFKGKIVAISGFKNEDIADDQYIMFLKCAHQHGCKLHCLGMTRTAILDKVPFDYVDSSSWKQPGLYAQIRTNKGPRKVNSDWYREANGRDIVDLENYKKGMALQKKYYEKWRNVNEN